MRVMATKTKDVPKEKAFNSQELSAIIRVCSELGASEMSFQGLHVSFFPKGSETKTVTTPPEVPPPEAAISDSEHKKQTEQSLLQEELRMRDSQVDHLLITDPLRAEQMIEDGELVDDDDYDGDGAGRGESESGTTGE